MNPDSWPENPFSPPFDQMIRELVRPKRDYALLQAARRQGHEIMPGTWLLETGGLQ